MYPFGGLAENLVAFGAYLRREHGFLAGPGELHDAARALEIVDLTDVRIVRDALRPILSGSVDEATTFDEAFSAFFFPGPPGIAQPAVPVARHQRDEAPDMKRTAREHERHVQGDNAPPGALEGGAAAPAAQPAEGEQERSARPHALRADYSPLEADASPDAPTLMRADAAWRQAARSLVRRVELGVARRWRPARTGQRFDLRRTLRASLQTGGETLTSRWLRRPKRAPRFVLLVDGSRSMHEHAATALRIAVALATVSMRVEVFTFSTRLERVTDRIRRAAAGDVTRLEHLQSAWGGGTAIGACLRDFLQRFGERLLGPATLVVIASDGLDVGSTDVLRDAMWEIHRRAAGVVWLNPLLETAGYEPTAAGMLAARPSITNFAAVHDATALARLARGIRVRR